jgi:hypothetical protein
LPFVNDLFSPIYNFFFLKKKTKNSKVSTFEIWIKILMQENEIF